jgi:hypothetical protein
MRCDVKPAEVIGPIFLQEPGTYRGGGHITISKKPEAYTFHPPTTHPLRPKASPEPTEFGPRPLSSTKARSCILSADCMRELPLPRMSCPSEKPFVHFFNPTGSQKKTTQTFPLPTPPRPAPEILPEMTPMLCISTSDANFSLPRRRRPPTSSFSFPWLPT